MYDRDSNILSAMALIEEDASALSSAMELGQVLPVSPEVADYMGALEEDALDEEAAYESRYDHLEGHLDDPLENSPEDNPEHKGD